jgi:hypothetical protein
VPGSDCNAIADGVASLTALAIDWNHPARRAGFAIDGYAPA